MFWFLTSAIGHPFEAELYGHDMHVVFQDQSIDMMYHLEIPFEVVQGDLTELVSENRDMTMETLRRKYLTETYHEIAQSLSLQIDGVDVSWDTAAPISDKLKKEDRFLIFTLHASKKLHVGASQISILNRNHEQKLSMYRSRIEYQGGVWIDETDLDTPKQWSKEESMKELRISVRILPSWWAHGEKLWNNVLNREPLSSFSNRQHSWKQRFMRGELHLHEALLASALSLFFFLLSPLPRTRSMFAVILASIGLGVLLLPYHDSRVAIIPIVGLIASLYPPVVVILIMSVALPWWFSLLSLFSFVRTSSLKRSWIISIGLSLAFSFMLF